MTMYCTNCGAPLDENTSFCTNCGQNQSTAAQTNMAQPYQTQVYQAPQVATYPITPDLPPVRKSKKKFVIAALVIIVIAAALAAALFILNEEENQRTKIPYGSQTPIVVSGSTVVTPYDSNSAIPSSYKICLIPLGQNALKCDPYVMYSTEFNEGKAFEFGQIESIPTGRYIATIEDTSNPGNTTTRVLPPLIYTGASRFSDDGEAALEEVTFVVSDQDTALSTPTTNEALAPLYYSLCMDLIAQYGEPDIANAGSNSAYRTGLALAQLVDFDRNGIYELLVAYETNAGEQTSSEDYQVEVWGPNESGDIKQLWKGDASSGAGGPNQWVELAIEDNGNIYLQYAPATSFDTAELYGFKDGEFKLVYSYEELGDEYKLDGKTVTSDEMNAFRSNVLSHFTYAEFSLNQLNEATKKNTPDAVCDTLRTLILWINGDEVSEIADFFTYPGVSARSAEILSAIIDKNQGSNQTSSTSTSTTPFWGVWTDASKSKSEAEQKAAAQNGTVVLTTDWGNLNSETWYVVSWGGTYSSEALAQEALSKAKAAGYTDAYVKYSGNYKG